MRPARARRVSATSATGRCADRTTARPSCPITPSQTHAGRTGHIMTEHVSPAARPWTLSTEAPFALRRDGAPALLVGGQVFNSASSSPKAIADSFAHVRRVGANVVLSPVSWALSEPAEGTFDFSLVDIMLAEARTRRASPGAALVRRLQERGVDLCADVGAQQPAAVPARRRRTEGHAGFQLRGSDREAGSLGLQPGAARGRRHGLRSADPAPRRRRPGRHGRHGAGRERVRSALRQS